MTVKSLHITNGVDNGTIKVVFVAILRVRVRGVEILIDFDYARCQELTAAGFVQSLLEHLRRATAS
jgi:hypothetical protein